MGNPNLAFVDNEAHVGERIIEEAQKRSLINAHIYFDTHQVADRPQSMGPAIYCYSHIAPEWGVLTRFVMD